MSDDRLRLTSEFALVALGEIAHVEMGQSPDSTYVVEDPFVGKPFLQGNAEFGAVFPAPRYGCLRPAKVCKADDVLISVRAPVGATNIADRDYCIGRGLAAIRVREVKPSMAAEIIARQSPSLRRVAQGTTFEAINKSDLLSLQLALPPSNELRQIASILDTLDTAIRETEAIIAKLKTVKQGLLHDLLTRGIDANGELRPPQAEAQHLYKDSSMGWMPKEWGQASARDLCSVITKGTTPATAKMWQGGGGIRFLRVDNLTFDGQFDFRASNFYVSPRTHRGELARSVCRPGDVLTNIVGPPLGKLGQVDLEAGEVNINQAIALFRPRGSILSSFLLLWLGSSLAQIWLRRRAKQTSGQVNLTLALCQELPTPEVSIEEQRSIVSRAASVDERLSFESSMAWKLARAKSGLMDDLLTGRVRVTPLL